MEILIKALKEKLGKDVLSEDLITDLEAQFEIMVNEKVQEKLEIKEKELEESSEEEMTEFKDSLIESLDKYIEYASEEYLTENEVAIESGAKILAAEKIIEATKSVFKEVGMEIPETEIDHVKDVENELKESTEKLNKAIDDVIEAKKQMFEYEKAVSFQKLTTSLTESKIEEVHTLLEGLEYKDVNDFDRKVKLVMEKIKTKVITEDNDDLDDLESDDEQISSIDKYLV